MFGQKEKGSSQAPDQEILTAQMMADKAIKLAREKGRNNLAKSIASLGNASKALIQAEFLPELEEKVESIKGHGSKAGEYFTKILDIINLLKIYDIYPADLIDKAFSYMLDRKEYSCAAALARKGSASSVLNVLLKNPSSEEKNRDMIDLNYKSITNEELSDLLKKLEEIPS
ncbi:MAG: hypothetical protein WCX77_04090 [Candidatus Paceibacterota bacterium]|jgi:hypothetical protein